MLRPLVNERFQGLFHSPPGVLFTFPSRYWSSIGLPLVFSLAGWSPRIPTGFFVSRRTQGAACPSQPCPYGIITLFDVPFQALPVRLQHRLAALQPHRRRNAGGLGSFPFDRLYSGNRCFFLFLQVLRCFSSLRSLLFRCQAFSLTGSPIRTPADQFVFADPRSFSQLTASFFACGSQGILRSLFLSSS